MIVVDTSSLIGAAIRKTGLPRRAIDFGVANNSIALSQEVFSEVVDVLNRPRMQRFIDPIGRAEVLALINDAAVWFKPYERVTDCRDPTDDKYLELALAAAAHTIVSGDNDLLVLHPWRGVRVLSPAQFLAAPRT